MVVGLFSSGDSYIYLPLGDALMQDPRNMWDSLRINASNTIHQFQRLFEAHGPCPVEIQQSSGEFLCLLEIYSQLQPKTVVEIGSFSGGTLWYYQKLNPAAKLISVDLNFDHFSRYDLFPNVTFIKGDSSDPKTVKRVLEAAPEGIDFLFIDGDHSFPAVRNDWELYSRFVRKGGVVAFHDIHCGTWMGGYSPGNPYDVRILWNEIQYKGYKTQQFIGLPEPSNQMYGIGVVYL